MEVGEGDGIVDDLDGDGAEGAVFIVGPDPDNPDEEIVIGIAVDLDDLHEFNVRFNQVAIKNFTELDGVEIMRTHRLSNKYKETTRQGNYLDIAYGVRFLRLQDTFSFDGTSDLLGASGFTTIADNQLVGPQIRARWSTQRGRWNWGIDGRCLFGYNITNLGQSGFFGLDGDPIVTEDDQGTVTITDPENTGLVPGGINRLISGQPTTFAYGKQDNQFSPTAELRATCSYQVTSSIALKLGYTGIFVDNISRASMINRYFLPDMGLTEGGKQEIYINGVDFGFDVVY